jgi:hypothetical protein
LIFFPFLSKLLVGNPVQFQITNQPNFQSPRIVGPPGYYKREGH